MQVLLPILHFAFMAAQVHGARVGFQLWREFKGRAREAGMKERVGSEDSGRSEESSATEAGAEKGMPTSVALRVEREAVADEDMEGSEGAVLCRYCGPADRLAVPTYPAC